MSEREGDEMSNGLSLSIQNDPLAVSDLLDDNIREREMYHKLVSEITRVLGDDARDIPLADLPEFIRARCVSWRPTAPKTIVFETESSDFGPYVLAFPVFGRVARVRWWQSKNGDERYQNFLEDGGDAVEPTAWMPLPAPPLPTPHEGR